MMGIFDSTSATNNTSKQQQNTFSEISGQVSNANQDVRIKATRGSQVSFTDQGSIQKAFDFAGQNSVLSFDALKDANSRAETALRTAGSTTSEAINAVQAAYSGEAGKISEKAITYGALILGLFIVSKVFIR